MSELASSPWLARGPWAGIVPSGRFGREGDPGVRVRLRENLRLATLIGREDRASDLGRALADIAGVAPPSTPMVAKGRDADLIWSGPDQWLLLSERPERISDLALRLAGLAAVSDQSDARAIVRVCGPKVRDALAKGCLVDLHPRAFKPGDAALTSIAHIGVQLWQVDDAPTYDLAVFRSMAASLWSWLAAAAAEYGYEVVASDGRG